ncbi:DUF262 domain-containing protein [Clostridium sp. MCC353]|uniref:DUF262 domain-containing protein n=1 Tax=Clostridium sp. MCC353 TaxID=2592646 RepID=UPI001C03746F|nr:DUF262 domain-containing protein [Clostridium sp. MCC353]MBT9775975.1 DUF262 domain-containing protein [Clostridium sp. MCC353]
MDILLDNQITEEIEDETVEHGYELEADGREEEQVYPMNKVKVDKGFYTVFELKRRFDAKPKRIILDSDFQRENVWYKDRKSELIESVLMGLPLPIFYFNQDKYGNLIVVDGRQRLGALFSFIDDEFKLSNLKILPEENNRKYSDLSPVLRGRIEDFQIQAHVILPPTPDRIKFDIFDRVNRGGVTLNKQEMRNALYQGEATRLLKRLIESEAFKNATGGAFLKEKRMKDRYLLTRFITFLLYKEQKIKDEKGERYLYKNDIDELLGNGMDTLNHMSQQEIQQIEQLVVETLEKSYYYLGKDAFRLTKGVKRTPINMNVFETVMYAIQYIPAGQKMLLPKVEQEISQLLNSAEFRDNIGNHRDSAEKLNWRLKAAEKIGRSLS